MSQATADAKTNKADDTALTTGDPGVPLKQDDYVPAIEHKTQLPGAQALTLVYDWLMDGAQRISEALGSQENEAVKQMLTEWMSVADTESQTLASKFAELYPDEPPLADMVTKNADPDTDVDADEAGDKTGDDMPAPDPEPDPEKYKGLTATERLQKRLDWRKSQREAVEKKRLDDLLTVKRMTKAAAGVVGEAADHLDDMAKSDGLKAGQRNLCRFHAGELKKLTTSEAGDEPDADDEIERKRIDTEIQTKAAELANRIVKEEITKLKAVVDPIIKEITTESKKAKRELEKAKTGR